MADLTAEAPTTEWPTAIPGPRDFQAEFDRRAVRRTRQAIAAQAGLGLIPFVRLAWPVLERSRPYVHGWHLDYMAKHLEAISRGTFLDMGLDNRLRMNVPPGYMKSLMVSVFWPAWEWGPFGRPDLQYLSTSWSAFYADRDAGKMYDLVTSDWYQELWGDQVRITRGGRTDFYNDRGGWRTARAFASLTSGRGDRVLIDDPHSTEKAESDAERETAIRIFRESLPNRTNDARQSAIVLIMQRLHGGDVSGVIEQMGLNYINVVLPERFEKARRAKSPLGIFDPRTYEGELLFPERFPPDTVERDDKIMGSVAVAGQKQQRPVPREGGMFKRAWFANRIKAAPTHVRWVRHFDLAATDEKFAQKNSARTAGVLIGMDPATRHLYVGDCQAARVENVQPFIKSIIADDAQRYPRYEVSLPQDPGQAGKVQKKALAGLCHGYSVHFKLETGDKATRAEPFAAQCEAGNVTLVEGPWTPDYVDELCDFPGSPLKDRVDASSGAYARLLVNPGDGTQGGNGRPVSIYGR